jgi:lipopolysaccharide export system protein LptA
VGRIHILVTLVVFGILIGGFYQGWAAPRNTDAVHIVSDRLEAYQQERQVIFLGNVVATQGDLTIRGDRMTIFYSEGGESEVSGNDLTRRLDRIVVEGNVRISQRKTVATGKHAVYYSSDNKVVLTGEPRVQRDKDFIQGSSITLFLDSEKSIVEGGPSRPVEATIYSSETETAGSSDNSSVDSAGKSGTDRDTGG